MTDFYHGDPGDENDTCPHGIKMSRVKELVFSGGVGFCRCCHNLFGTFSDGPFSHGVNLCGKCRNVLQ